MGTILIDLAALAAPASRAPVACQVDGCKRSSSFSPICDHHLRHAPGWLHGAMMCARETGNRADMAIAAKRIVSWYRNESTGARLRAWLGRARPRRVPLRTLPSNRGGTWLSEPRQRKIDEGYFRALELKRCMVDGCNEAQTGFEPICHRHFAGAPARLQGEIRFGQEVARRGYILSGGGRIRHYFEQEARRPAFIRTARRSWNILKGNRSTGELILTIGAVFAGAIVFAIAAALFVMMEPLP